MSIKFYDILNKNIKSEQKLHYYNNHLRDLFKKHHIGMQTTFRLIQSGGYQFNYDEDNIQYSVELYEPEYDKTDSDYEYINKYIYVYKSVPDVNSPYCCLLSYYNNTTLHIDVFETPIKCIKTKNSESSISHKYGKIMMNIIIKIAKKRGFVNIKLEDKSVFNCLDSKNNLKYSLKNVHILTSGYPWQKKNSVSYFS